MKIARDQVTAEYKECDEPLPIIARSLKKEYMFREGFIAKQWQVLEYVVLKSRI